MPFREREDKIGGHSPPYITVLAGGGMRTGQTIGSTSRYGEVPQTRPIKFQEVFATLYKCADIDAQNSRVFDLSGVPQYLVDPGHEPIHELV